MLVRRSLPVWDASPSQGDPEGMAAIRSAGTLARIMPGKIPLHPSCNAVLRRTPATTSDARCNLLS